MGNIWEGFEEGFGNMGDTLGNVAGQSPLLIVLYLLGEMMSKQQEKDVINPIEALRGSESKGITGAQGRTNTMQSMLQNAMAGQTPNPAVADMRTALQNRSKQEFSPPPVNPPARFNPYDLPPNTSLPTGVSPTLASRTTRMAQGGQGQTGLWGMNVLLNQLANRFGQRNMQGQLNPLNLPQGNTRLYNQ